MKTGYALTALAFCALAATPLHAQDSYKIGYLVDASGPGQSIFSPTLDGFNLYIDKVNAEGGVNGRKIEVMVRDVQVDPQRSASAAQELVSNGAIAIAGLTLTSTHMAVYAALNRSDVPVVAGYPANVGVVLPPKARARAYGVGLAFELTGEMGGMLARQASPKGKSFVCTVFESPGGFVACDSAIAGAKAAGFTSAERVTFPFQQRDFRGIAEKITQMKPDVLMVILGRDRTLSFLPALAETGFKGTLLSMEAGTGDDVLRKAAKESPGFEIYSYSRYAGTGQAKGAQLDALTAAVKKKGGSEALAFHSGGWALGIVMVDALKRCGADCTPTKLDVALASTNVAAEGLTGAPIRFTANDHYGPSAYHLFKYDRAKDQVVAVGDWLQSAGTPKYYKPAGK
jgi:branched-chain amino acid transport system substrate-binding protein